MFAACQQQERRRDERDIFHVGRAAESQYAVFVEKRVYLHAAKSRGRHCAHDARIAPPREAIYAARAASAAAKSARHMTRKKSARRLP